MKMKFWNASTGMFLVVSCLLAGCSGGSQPAKEGAADAKSKEPVKISMSLEGAGLPSPQEDWIKKELDKRLNTDISVTTIQGMNDYMNQMKIRSAAGNMPDLMMVDLATLNDFAQKGLLLDLTPHMDTDLKQAKDFMGVNLLKKGMVNGKNYAITRIADVPFSSYWIRQDWLTALNLKKPTTLEELYAVGKAFTEQDPDGNGKKDTYGFTGVEFNTFAPILGSYGLGLPGSSYVKDNKLFNAYYDPNMPAALEYLKKLVTENLVEPQFMTNKGTMARDQAIQGKAGIVFAGWTEIGKQEFIDQYKTVNPKADWVQMESPKGPSGQFDSAYDMEKPSRLLVIPKSVDKNPEKLKKIFELLNYVSGKEGNRLVMYGIEGRHYTVNGDKIELTEAMAKEGNYFHLYQMTGRPNEEYLKVKFPKEEAYMKFALKLPRLNNIDSSIIPPAGYNATDADRYGKEEIVKFIYNKRPLSEYPAFLKTMEDTFKYKLLMDEAQKRAKELEFIK
ncbi:extracellular solute-binding protein [Paenibacillus sp. FSL H7-0331]|uniref:extracellular solute-binding protein n=1 Tax=Paenibacillus sp. FSL H7-0331 TaxID=1920421 RepID=UPI00096CB294|nr:extracellular solute-binding protein [Paenibacillus sp. FSL H7-0331]OMF07151.1 hypothetical protein BK127_30365 [Paenibacillus sp. FSL H7-0331]